MFYFIDTYTEEELQQRYAQAARLIDEADSLIIAAGAGMGVDSGLPDFRGTQGFWQAYPALGKSGIRFERIASPDTFCADPMLAWGFYGHRLALYRATTPHEGFRILREIGEAMPHNAFVFTSNVDGQFQRAGFADDRIEECHGSIHYMQCLTPCCSGTWTASGFEPVTNDETCRLLNDLPRCPHCGDVARPAILMFGDWGWDQTRQQMQGLRFLGWRNKAKCPVVIELGAGMAIPSVRIFSEQQECPIIRINPVECSVTPYEGVGLPVGALDGMRGIRQALIDLGWTFPEGVE